MNIFKYLPLDVVKYILTYNRKFIIRKGEIVQINMISKTDERYAMLEKKPKIYIKKEPYNLHTYATYLDGEKLLAGRYVLYFVQLFNTSTRTAVRYLRKIDTFDKKEVSISRYKV